MKKRKMLNMIMGMYSPYKKEMVVILLGTVLSAVISIIYPLIMKHLLDTVIHLDVKEMIPILAKVTGILGILMVLEIYGIKIFELNTSVLYSYVLRDLKNVMYCKLQKLSFSWYDNAHIGGIISTLNDDTDNSSRLASDLIPGITTSILQFAMGISTFLLISPILMKPLLPIFIVLVVFSGIVVPKLKEHLGSIRKFAAKQFDIAEDALSGIRTVVGCGMEKKEIDKFCSMNEEIHRLIKKKWTMMFMIRSTFNTITSLYYNIMMIYGCYLAATGKISIMDMTIFYMYSHIIITPINNLSSIIREFGKSTASLERISIILDAEEEILNSENSIIPRIIDGYIDFNNVSFKYEDSNIVLNHIDLSIKKGEYVAIVGESGSGKSTIAGLIPRYYDVCDGCITIDGYNIKDIDLHTLRRSIGVVQQESYLFDGTILDNIKYAVPEANMEEVIEAAKKANAHEFISKLKNGYESVVGEKGVKLSGGQRQRIAIARMFLLNPPIMIFDEATSALDNHSEKEVQKSLDALAKDRTTIVIAHRLSTIQNADRIIMLSENGIEEEGDHVTLMNKGGSYSKLYGAVK